MPKKELSPGRTPQNMTPVDLSKGTATMGEVSGGKKTNTKNVATDVFNVKGPMGKGLCIEPSGVHVAFCAGTGVLVFLDLVSHMLLRSYYKHYVDPEKVPAHMH